LVGQNIRCRLPATVDGQYLTVKLDTDKIDNCTRNVGVINYPDVNAANAKFNEDLTKVLNRSGIRVVNDPDIASAIIDLVSVKFDRQVLSINSRGQATGYILTYQVLCRFVDRTGRVLASPARLKLSRTLEYQSTQVLPKKQEEDALRARMREDLVQQILRRLNSVSQASPGGLKTEQFS
jgi:outer membrane lipopolysaccharide assembly protein LptE/RlpB